MDSVEGMKRSELSELIRRAVEEVLEQKLSKISDRIERIESSLVSRIYDLEKERDDVVTKLQSAEQGIEVLRQEVRSVRIHANDNEQYSRRECVNLYGLKPIDLSSHRSQKEAVASILTQKLGKQIPEGCIDIAHPLASPKDGKVALIVKFNKREKRDEIMMSRKKLKGTGITLQDSLTKNNASLLRQLNKNKDLKNAWSWKGQIWAQSNSGTKFKVNFLDSIDQLITAHK